MRDLTANELGQVSGGAWLPDIVTAAGVFASRYNPNAALVTGAFDAGYAIGTDINSSLSQQTRSAIGYTTYQLVNHPINSITNAINYWL